jgi:hypothetical protein
VSDQLHAPVALPPRIHRIGGWEWSIQIAHWFLSSPLRKRRITVVCETVKQKLWRSQLIQFQYVTRHPISDFFSSRYTFPHSCAIISITWVPVATTKKSDGIHPFWLHFLLSFIYDLTVSETKLSLTKTSHLEAVLNTFRCKHIIYIYSLKSVSVMHQSTRRIDLGTEAIQD